MSMGLTEYEARAYTALLALGRAAPSRLAREARIPRPKVYETLQRLEARGLALRASSAPLIYVPLAAREYLARAERDFSARLGGARDALARLTPESSPEAVYPLAGREAILALAGELAGHAQRRLSLVGPPELLRTLEGRANRVAALTVAHSWPSIAEGGQEPLLVARDGEAALVAHITPSDEHWHGVHTHSPLIVRLVEGFASVCAAGG